NLTGTPCPNGLTDLWGQFWFVDFGARLGRTYTSFLNRWFHVNEYTHQITAMPGAEKEIYAALADVMLVLRAEDWLDILKPLPVPIEVELPAEARKLYDRMEDEYFTEIGDLGIEAFNAAAKSMKCLQLCSGSIYDNSGAEHAIHNAKIEALEDVVEQCGEPLLVVYHWKFDVPRILKAFPRARVLENQKDVDDWNAGRIEMLLVHPQRAGHGLNLQDGGRDIAFFSHTWDLELRDQVIERIGPARQAQAGHHRVVRIWDLIVRNSMEVEVLERLEGKVSLQDALKLARARRR
ncbi:MAG: DEAD/DEAH box helicase, partial [Patescibacteria group bacterium]|nr:DEAD/DEAH box helicase [Patescibacteria group bacterium]